MTSLQYRIFLFVKLVPLCLIWFLVCLLESFYILSTNVSHTLGGRDSRPPPLPPVKTRQGWATHTQGGLPACLPRVRPVRMPLQGEGHWVPRVPRSWVGFHCPPIPIPPPSSGAPCTGCGLVYGWFTGENKNQGLELSAVGSDWNGIGLFYGHFQVQLGSWVNFLPLSWTDLWLLELVSVIGTVSLRDPHSPLSSDADLFLE